MKVQAEKRKMNIGRKACCLKEQIERGNLVKRSLPMMSQESKYKLFDIYVCRICC